MKKKLKASFEGVEPDCGEQKLLVLEEDLSLVRRDVDVHLLLLRLHVQHHQRILVSGKATSFS